MKVVIVMNPDPNSWVRPRVVEQNLFHPRVGEENTDQFPCRFLVVFVIVPGDWKLKAVFAKRTHVDLKAVNMRRVSFSAPSALLILPIPNLRLSIAAHSRSTHRSIVIIEGWAY